MKRWIGPLIVVLVVALLGYGLLNEDSTPKSPLEGKAAPEFTLKSMDGETYQLASLKGKPVVINFWASWCLPCRVEAPVFRNLIDKSGDQVHYLGISFNDNEKNAREFLKEFDLNIPTLLDPQSKVAIDYGIGQIPVTLVLDQDGKIVYRHLGEVDQPTMQGVLNKLGVKL